MDRRFGCLDRTFGRGTVTDSESATTKNRLTHMERYQIKVQLLGRIFPMMVSAKEEETILMAVKLIEEKIETYRDKYKINDDAHLLSMCCLDIANEFMRAEKENQNFRNFFSRKLSVMSDLLDASMQSVKVSS